MKGTALILVCLLGLSAGFEDKTVAQWLKDNNYHTLVDALTVTGLINDLDSTGPFTVFVPTDAVFNTLGYATLQGLLNDTNKLSLIMKYHVVPGFVLVPSITGPTDKMTLNGENLVIEPYNGGLLLNNISRVSAGNKDIILNNGVVQPVDTVLIPANVPDLTIAQKLLALDGEFTDFFLALLIADLTTLLDSGSYTVFAPVDSAFNQYKDNLLNPSQPGAQAVYTEVMKYHIVPGSAQSSQLVNGQVLTTLHGTTLTVTIDNTGVYINSARVVDADIMATNGVIHGVDKILVPQDINQIAQG